MSSNSTSPRTVLYLTPSMRMLGARRALQYLATGLDRTRWRPVVCGQGEGDLEDELHRHGIPYEKLFLGWWRKGKYFLRRPAAISQLAALIERVGADLVHCNEIYPNPYAVRACARVARRRHRPVPLVTHMRLSITPRMIQNYDMRRANMVLVVSEGAGRDFDLWPDKDERVRVVHDGVDLNQFGRTRDRAQARRGIGIAPDGLLFAAIGQLGPRKGGDIILDAMEELAESYPDSKVMFVGDPHRGQEDFAEELKRRAESPALADRVFFFPFTPKILPFYESADVNLLISRDEGFGLTTVEAACSATPTIGARVGGIPEVVADKLSGFLVEKEDPAALATAMRRFLNEPALATSMGRDAAEHVEANFSLAAHIDKMMKLYDEVLAREDSVVHVRIDRSRPPQVESAVSVDVTGSTSPRANGAGRRPLPASRAKTVLYLTPSSRLLGARRSLLSLASGLDPERWRPIVCGQSHGDLEVALGERGIPYERLMMGWWRKGKYFIRRPWAISQLRELIANVGADLVHCNEIYPNPYAVRAVGDAMNNGGRTTPVITHMRLSVTRRMVSNYDLHSADLVVVPSHQSSQDFDFWEDKAERVRVIHNGVNTEEFRRTRSREQARAQLGLPIEGPLFASLGQLGPRKGGDLVLTAMAEIAKRHPTARLMFAGDAHRGQEGFAEQLRRRAAQPDLAGRVFFFPFDPQVLPYYEAIDVNLIISREEGFGRTIIEAGSLGVPSIGARAGGIPEVVADEETGLLVEKENPEALATAMARFLDNPELIGSFGENALKHVEQDFSIRAHVQKMMAAYDEVLENSQASRIA